MIRFILLFVVFFWVAFELIAVSQFAAHFGIVNVFLEVIASMVIGFKLLSSQPGGLMQKLQQEIAAGHDPKNFLFGRLRVFFAGFLLVLPGLISDGLGLLLLLMNFSSRESSESASYSSPWNAENRAANEPHKDFEDAWEGDEFTKRMRKHQAEPDHAEVVDAQIISTEDKEDKK